MLLSRGLCWSQTLWLSATIICFNTISSACVSLETRAGTLWGPQNDSYLNLLKRNPPPHKRTSKIRANGREKKKWRGNESRGVKENGDRRVDSESTESKPGREIRSESKLPVTLSPLPLTTIIHEAGPVIHSTEHLLASHSPDHSHTSSIIDALPLCSSFFFFSPFITFLSDLNPKHQQPDCSFFGH